MEEVFDQENWPCPLLERTFAAMVETGVIPRMPDPVCVVHNNHLSHQPAETAGVDLLHAKLGDCAANAIKEELRGTKYEWMTNLSLHSAPEGFAASETKAEEARPDQTAADWTPLWHQEQM